MSLPAHPTPHPLPTPKQVRLNRGLLGVAQGQCEAAAHDFDAVLQLDPTNAVAANNRAVCQLYCCRLGLGLGPGLQVAGLGVPALLLQAQGP